MPTDQLRRIVRQNAQTTGLLGVDFVPDFRKINIDEVVPTESEPVQRPESGAKVTRNAQIRLEELRARYEADAPHQHFVTDHHTIVFGEGNPDACLMFIGEAPGAEEDRLGRPFVGRSGQLLDKMIGAMGLRREDVYIANVLKTRPPNNATPTVEEAKLCAPYLMEQILIVDPDILVTLGRPAAQLLLETTQTMGRLRGRWANLCIPGCSPGQSHDYPVLPTYHPAYLLRQYNEENRRKVWSDLQMVMERLKSATP